MESFRIYLESSDLEALVQSLKNMYPGIDLFVTENNYRIHVHEIRVLDPKARGQGVGTKVMQAIQQYAQSIGKPIQLTPQGDKGKKAKLLKFYRNLGFYPNKGRHTDYSLSSVFGGDWLWKPTRK